jgi:hypothetical protein
VRYTDLFDAGAWRRYSGRDRRCLVLSCASREHHDVLVQFGQVTTGKQRVFAGYFVQVVGPGAEERLFEDAHSLRGALQAAASALKEIGFTLEVIGSSANYSESPMSANSGYGYHPSISGAVHMLDRFDCSREEATGPADVRSDDDCTDVRNRASPR